MHAVPALHLRHYDLLGLLRITRQFFYLLVSLAAVGDLQLALKLALHGDLVVRLNLLSHPQDVSEFQAQRLGNSLLDSRLRLVRVLLLGPLQVTPHCRQVLLDTVLVYAVFR